LRTVVDQNQTKHTYERDALGRVLRDTPAFASGSGIDDAIKRIAVSYDNFGRLETVKSYSAIGATNTTVRNEVEFAYTKLWQVSNVYQDVNGEVEYNGSGVPIGDTILVSYGYANSAAPTAGSAAANFSRLTSMTYPNGNVVNYGYGTAGGLDDRISRARSLADPGDSDNIVEYSRVGLDFFAIVDYPLADVQLDRTFSRNGQRSMWSTQGTGVYPGWDRHGRVSIHAWMDGGLDEGTNGLPTRPPIVDEGYAYDKSSNRLTKYDMRPGAPTSTNPDWQFTYDGLDRLTEAKKGDRNASTFATGFGSHKWVLDVLGNWVKHHKELDGTNPYGGTGETEDRTHNAANEITNRYPNGSSSSPTLPFAYDHAGNLKQENYSAGQNHVFKHDAWNRLVKHEFGGSPAPTYPVNAEYEYNGLHWRTIKRIPPQSPAAEEEQQQGVPGVLRSMYYSAAWQLIEERIDEDYTGSPGVNRIAQEVWGLRYIDDAVMRIPEVGDGPPRFYHLTDVQFSTVSMIGLGGTYAPLVERVGYDPYGRATHRWEGDVNNDGAFDDTDRNLIKDAAGTGYSLGDSGYDVRMDLDRDGDVDNDDKDIAYAMGDAAALAPGEISGRGAGNVDNIFGYDGYVFAPENQRYCVRFRWYDPATGRWMERDPAGYVGGASLYEAVRSHPMATDPLGLWCRRGDTLVAEQGDTLASLMKLLNMPLRGFFSSLSIFNTPIPPGTQLQTSLLTDALAHELGASSMRLLNAIRSAAAHCGGDDDELRLLIDQLSAELNFALKVGAAVSDSLGDAARGAADAIYSAWDHRGIPAHEMDEMWKQNGRAARLLMLSWAARTGSTLLDVRQLYEAIRSGDFRAIIAPLSSLGAAAADIALRKLKSPTAVIRRANLVLAAGEVLASGIEIWSVGSELSAQKAQRRSVCDRLKKAMPGLAERQNQAFQQYMSLQVALDRIPCCKEDQIGPNVD
jgi:RHS repeat-associated protein